MATIKITTKNIKHNNITIVCNNKKSQTPNTTKVQWYATIKITTQNTKHNNSTAYYDGM